MPRVVKAGPQMPKKDPLVLGVVGEVHSYDFTSLGSFGESLREVEEIIEFIHAVAYVELLSRPVETMCDWPIRVKTMFLRNRLVTVSDVMCLNLDQVNRLAGCGYKTRQEVYQTFNGYGLSIESWMPGHYWDRMNYKFTDD